MRRFLHDLTLLAAVAAAGGYALSRVESSPAQPMALRREPVVSDAAPPPSEKAMDVLRNATVFSSVSVGSAGVVPETVVAWLTILSQPDAGRMFVDLLHTATPAGRVYALAGLRTINPPLFRRWAHPFFNSPILVRTMGGCILRTMTTGGIVDELQRGMWIGDFVTASRSRYVGDLPWPRH